MIGWSFANAHYWVPDLPIDPPTTEYDKYEYQWDEWLNENYDKETDTIFGVDANDNQALHDELWEKFMKEVIEVYWD